MARFWCVEVESLPSDRPACSKSRAALGQSFEEFVKHKTEFTAAGNLQTSGNGSLMRNAPVAVLYRDDHTLGNAMSYKQGKTTHQGEEAAEFVACSTAASSKASVVMEARDFSTGSTTARDA